MAIYLKFRGISAQRFDTLHALGLVSKSCMNQVRECIDKFQWMISYDNVNIHFRVFSQQLDNQADWVMELRQQSISNGMQKFHLQMPVRIFAKKEQKD